MFRWFAVSSAIGLVAFHALIAGAQTAPAPSASPAASPDPVIGPAYGANDPCASLAAIISRPSQTTSVCTVRSNHVLVESGYQNLTADATSTTVSYPQATVRIGTAVPALELDLGVPADERLNAGGMMTAGATDVGAGLKYVFGYSPRFNYGANVFFTAPTGTGGFSAGAGTQAYDLNYGYTINSILSLAGTFGFDRLASGGQAYDSFIPSLVLGASLPNMTGLFVEAAAFTHGAGPGTPTRTQFITGITRGVSARLQLDLEAGRSFTTATGKYRFVGFGASYYL